MRSKDAQKQLARTSLNSDENIVKITLITFCLLALTKPGGVLPYLGYIGMCRCEGYGFQAVHSSVGYINQSVWV